MISCNAIEQALEKELNSSKNKESVEFRTFCEKVCSALNASGKDDVTRVEHQLELILRDNPSYFFSNGKVYSRAAFFKGMEFKVVPTDLELRKNILIAGARFAPFCCPELFSDDYELVLPSGRNALFTDICASFSELNPIYLLMGRSLMIDCLVAECEENRLALRSTARMESAKMQVAAFDIAEFYRDTEFQRGDAIIFRVEDWDDCRFSMKHLPASKFAQRRDREEWIRKLEEAMLRVCETEKDYQEMPEQMSRAFLYAFEDGNDLRHDTSFSLDEYRNDMREISIRCEGPDWLFVPADDVADAGAVPESVSHDHDDHECECGHDHDHNHEEEKGVTKTESGISAGDFTISEGTLESMDAILKELGAPMDYIELYAMIVDAVANAVDYETFESSVRDRLNLKFTDDAQEAAFCNFLEDDFEVCTENFVPDNDMAKAPLRARLLELTDQRIDLSRNLLERFKDKVPKSHTGSIKNVHRMILDTLAFLNTDTALTEDEEIEQLEMRIGDIEDAWDDVLERLDPAEQED